MYNIFTALRILTELRKKPNLTAKQEAFINKLLDEEAFAQIIKKPSTAKITHLIDLVGAEISHSSYWYTTAPLTNLKYIRELKKVLKILSSYKNHLEKLEKPDYVSNLRDELLKNLDLIYEETVKTYNGDIMLPIFQGVDIASFGDGNCFGFVAKWAIDLLNKNAAYGINIDESPIFKPIKLSSMAGKKYPDLNHLARLTDTIANYQYYQKKLKSFLQTLSNESVKDIEVSGSMFPRFYDSIEQLANHLIKLANENEVNNVIGLNLFGYNIGHALGFYHKNDKYHFFDSNSGWYRFNKAEDFIRWLPFYCNKMKYDKLFLEHTIIRYAKSVIGKSLESQTIDANIFVKIALQLILCPITVPVYSYFFGIRGIIYGAHNTKNILSDLIQSKLLDSPRSELNDLGVTDDEDTNASFSKYQNLDALLDIPRDEIINLEKKSINNPIFTKIRLDKEQQTLNVPQASTAKTNLFFNTKQETINFIDSAISRIENSSYYYRRDAKKQKLNVLKAGKDYLTNKISIEQFESALAENPDYAAAFGKSNTNAIVQRILAISDLEEQATENNVVNRLNRKASMLT